MGLIVAFAGFLIVAFDYEQTRPALHILANGFWVVGFFGLILIIGGTLIVVVKR